MFLVETFVIFCLFFIFADMGKIPQRRANLTLKVDMLYSPQYEDLNSTLSVKFITTLEPLVVIF